MLKRWDKNFRNNILAEEKIEGETECKRKKQLIQMRERSGSF
jgi:hypothetical protein